MNEELIHDIRHALKKNKQGLTLGEIATAVHTHRNSAAKYLDVLLSTGQVNLRTVGRAKLYTLSQTLPIHELMNISTDYHILIDDEGRITQHSSNIEQLSTEKLLNTTLASHNKLSTITSNKHSTVGRKQYETKQIPVVLGNGTAGTLITIEDVTEQKAQEQQLRLLKRAVESSASSITIVDMKKKDQPLIYINHAFERITSYTKKEVIGKNCRFLQGKGSDEKTKQAIKDCIKTGQQGRFEILNYRKDGTSFWNELFLAPVKDEHGNITHYVGTQSDVSYRHKRNT